MTDLDGHSWIAECEGRTYYCTASTTVGSNTVTTTGECLPQGYDEHWKAGRLLEQGRREGERGHGDEARAAFERVRSEYPNAPQASEAEVEIQNLPGRLAEVRTRAWARNGLFLGLGGGPGLAPFDAPRAYVQLNLVGWAFKERWSLSLAFSSATAARPAAGGTSEVLMQHVDAMLYWYWYDNFYLKAGGGLVSTSDQTTDGPRSQRGLSVVGGAGYEYRLLKWLALSGELGGAYAYAPPIERLVPGVQLGATFYVWRGN